MVLRQPHLQTAAKHATISNTVVFIVLLSVSEFDFMQCIMFLVYSNAFFFMGVVTGLVDGAAIQSEFILLV